MIDDGNIPPGLPVTLTLQQLIWLTGLTKERLSQLSGQRVVIRTDRDTYSITTIRRLSEHQRKRNIGPSAWNTARSKLASERAAMAKLNRLEREGELVRRDVMREISCSIVAAARDRFLGMPAKLAHRLAVEPKPPGASGSFTTRSAKSCRISRGWRLSPSGLMDSEARLIRRAADLMAAPDAARSAELAEASTLLMADVVRQRSGVTGDFLPLDVFEAVRDEVMQAVRERVLAVAKVAAPAMVAATCEADVTTAFNDALVETLALKH